MQPKPTAFTTSTRFLTDDLVEMFTDKRGSEFPVRIRVWRGKDVTAIVLASHVYQEGCFWSPPSRLTSVIANFVNATIVGYRPEGMVYFEDEVDGSGERNLTVCRFEFCGDSSRLKFFKPAREPQRWESLESILGTQPADKPLKG